MIMAETVGTVAGVAAAAITAAKLYAKYKKKDEEVAKDALENFRECLRMALSNAETGESGKLDKNDIVNLMRRGFEKKHTTAVHVKGGPRIDRTVVFRVRKVSPEKES
jgi:hypothetical protein